MTELERMDDYTGLMPIIISEESDQAELLSGFLWVLLAPASVIDVGCGPGLYLTPFLAQGAAVFGIDGCSDGGKSLPADAFEIVDLRIPWKPTRRYDLAICIEVGEHLHERYADTLVDTLVACSDTVFFTAAVPGQGGWSHHNEQPQEYWANKFAARGYGISPDNPAIQEHLAQEDCYLSWLKNNSILFRRLQWQR